MPSRFAVLGSPIDHSLSPALHSAAIAVLGIDATYDRFNVTEDTLDSFLRQKDTSWEGFSLTMPLKQVARRVVVRECEYSTATGSINTLVRTPHGFEGFNTDVWGAKTAISQQLGSHFSSAAVLGAGATASSLVVALDELGVRRLDILVRVPERAEKLRSLAEQRGMTVSVSPLGATVSTDIVVNTIPGSQRLDPEVVDAVDAACAFDVSYHPWPSDIAREWEARGLLVAGGHSMLLWQAVLQARLFYGGDLREALPDEEVVITAMRASIGL